MHPMLLHYAPAEQWPVYRVTDRQRCYSLDVKEQTRVSYLHRKSLDFDSVAILLQDLNQSFAKILLNDSHLMCVRRPAKSALIC